MRASEPWDPLGRYFVADIVDDLFAGERAMSDHNRTPSAPKLGPAPPAAVSEEPTLSIPPVERSAMSNTEVSEEPGFTREDVTGLRELAKQHDDDADNFELTGPVALWLTVLADRVERALAPSEPVESEPSDETKDKAIKMLMGQIGKLRDQLAQSVESKPEGAREGWATEVRVWKAFMAGWTECANAAGIEVNEKEGEVKLDEYYTALASQPAATEESGEPS